MPAIKIVFGEMATRKHADGESDEVVGNYGSIEEFEFDTEAEIDAFLLGLNSMDGWGDWMEYQE